MTVRHIGTSQWVPSGGPSGANLEHFQGPEACKSNCQPTVHLPWFHLGHGMGWHHALCGLGGHPRKLVGQTERLVEGTQSHKPDTYFGYHQILKKGDGSAFSFKAKAAETRRLAPCGVRLAETKQLHVLIQVLWELAGWCTYYSRSTPNAM